MKKLLQTILTIFILLTIFTIASPIKAQNGFPDRYLTVGTGNSDKKNFDLAPGQSLKLNFIIVWIDRSSESTINAKANVFAYSTEEYNGLGAPKEAVGENGKLLTQNIAYNKNNISLKSRQNYTLEMTVNVPANIKPGLYTLRAVIARNGNFDSINNALGVISESYVLNIKAPITNNNSSFNADAASSIKEGLQIKNTNSIGLVVLGSAILFLDLLAAITIFVLLKNPSLRQKIRNKFVPQK